MCFCVSFKLAPVDTLNEKRREMGMSRCIHTKQRSSNLTWVSINRDVRVGWTERGGDTAVTINTVNTELSAKNLHCCSQDHVALQAVTAFQQNNKAHHLKLMPWICGCFSSQCFQFHLQIWFDFYGYLENKGSIVTFYVGTYLGILVIKII